MSDFITAARLRPDRRRQRAMVLEAEIMRIVAKYVNEDRERDCMRDLSRELFDELHTEGVEIITDAARADAGLPPRGPDGWTQEELLALERRRLEVMMAPMPQLQKMYPSPDVRDLKAEKPEIPTSAMLHNTPALSFPHRVPQRSR